MFKIELLKKNAEPEWDNFVNDCVVKEYGFSLKFRDVIKEVFRYETIYYFIRNGRGIIGVLPLFLVRSKIFSNRLVSIPFTDTGGFYFKERIQDDLKVAIYKSVIERLSIDLRLYSDRALPIEIRNPHPASNEFLIKNCGFVKISPYVRFKIRLDTTWQQIENSFSRNIKRCLEKGKGKLKIDICSDKNQLIDIYKIYLKDTKRLGSPPLPLRFFEEMWDKFQAIGNFIIFTGSYKNKVVAAETLISFKNTIYADLIMSDAKYNYIFPKIQLYFASLNYAYNSNKYMSYDFSRTRRLSGVFEHKRKWGGEIEEIEYFYQNYSQVKDCFLDHSQSRFSYISKIIKFTPLSILRIAGRSIRKQLGK
ncbi:MAG: GNAT family N-acetyltransferase [Candidatus Omnitrophota bacterium]